MVEKHNQAMQQAIKACIEKQTDWYEVLDSIAMSFRGSQHCSTRKSPYEMMYGKQMLLPIQLRTNPHHMPPTSTPKSETTEENENKDDAEGDNAEPSLPLPSQEEIFDHLMVTRDRIHKSAGINILEAQDTQKRNYDRRHGGIADLEVGDKILKEEQVQKARKGGKLVLPWEGPYTITKVHDNGNYTVKNKHGVTLTRKVPCDQVKLYLERKRPPIEVEELLQLAETNVSSENDENSTLPTSPKKKKKRKITSKKTPKKTPKKKKVKRAEIEGNI